MNPYILIGILLFLIPSATYISFIFFRYVRFSYLIRQYEIKIVFDSRTDKGKKKLAPVKKGYYRKKFDLDYTFGEQIFNRETIWVEYKDTLEDLTQSVRDSLLNHFVRNRRWK